MKLLKQVNIGKFGIRPANYSGITHIEGNRYAVVDDKELVDGFMFLDIDIDSRTGEIRDVQYAEPAGYVERKATLADPKSVYRDCEGIAFCKQTNTVFISGEVDQRIAEYDLDGLPTGRELAVPEYMQIGNIEKNYGFEALTYNAETETFWTTTEATLVGDGVRSSLKNRDVHNLLRIQSFGLDLKPAKMYAYKMDKLQAKAKVANHVHGVPTMLAMPDGRLIVMEREACIPRRYFGSFCTIKLYEVNPAEGTPIASETKLSELPDADFLSKRLICQFTTHVNYIWNFANYEGMCFGPTLDDGRQTLLLICDSQGGHGNAVYHLKDWMKVIIL